MNINWQLHNTQQEKKIREQSERIAQLEMELASQGSSLGQLPESQQIKIDQMLLAKKHLCESLEEEKSRVRRLLIFRHGCPLDFFKDGAKVYIVGTEELMRVPTNQNC